MTILKSPAVLLALFLYCAPLALAEEKLDTSRGDKMLADYFRAETAKLRDACLADIKTLDDWKSKRGEYRRQLFEMLSLDPLPEKTDLKATITGQIEAEDFVVEKLHFQSRPKLYVTANLYRPKKIDKPAPAILYLCGHGPVKKNGISYGNKVHYQHHGAWFARHGYVCLVIDTLQLGEIEGLHHGTYRENMWWWNSRGYTPAGVETWNSIRALDYLASRKEVDAERIGVTGRSGGGAYSWFVAAVDDRVKVAVPVAGITDLENHVVDGCVEGHCDCMYLVNTYRWDYPQLAALVAPRPLLISNTDKDNIFPLDGVQRTHALVKKIYKLHGAEKNLGLHITEGPHADTQELQIHAFVWFNRFLKNENPPIDKPAQKYFEPEQLKVFDKLPADQINTKIHETFVPLAPAPKVPESKEAWAKQRDEWMKALKEKVFRGWPEKPCELDVKEAFNVERHGLRFAAYDFNSQENVRLRLYVIQRAGVKKIKQISLEVLDEKGWKWMLASLRPGFAEELAGEVLPPADDAAFSIWKESFTKPDADESAMTMLAPRGIGSTAWNQDPKKQTQVLRRFMLLGQTVDGMRVWDVRRAVQAARSIDRFRGATLGLAGDVNAMTAALFQSDIDSFVSTRWFPTTRDDEPRFLNSGRYFDTPALIAMAAERSPVIVYTEDEKRYSYPEEVARRLDWDKQRVFILNLPPSRWKTEPAEDHRKRE